MSKKKGGQQARKSLVAQAINKPVYIQDGDKKVKVRFEYKGRTKVSHSKDTITGDTSIEMKKESVGLIAVKPSDRKLNRGLASYNPNVEVVFDNKDQIVTRNNRKLNKARTTGRMAKDFNAPQSKKAMAHLRKVNRLKEALNGKHGLSKLQIRNNPALLHKLRYEARVNRFTHLTGYKGKVIHVGAGIDKEQVMSYVRSENCKVSYSGKSRTMYIESNLGHDKVDHTNHVMNLVRNEFGAKLPFSLHH